MVVINISEEEFFQARERTAPKKKHAARRGTARSGTEQRQLLAWWRAINLIVSRWMDGSVFLKCRFHPENRISWPPFNWTYGAVYSRFVLRSPWVIYSCRGAPLNYARNYAYLHRVSACPYGCCAYSRNLLENGQKNRERKTDREERLPREKVEEKRLIVNDRERKRIHKRARNCNFSPYCSRQSCFFCEVLMTSRVEVAVSVGQVLSS